MLDFIRPRWSARETVHPTTMRQNYRCLFRDCLQCDQVLCWRWDWESALRRQKRQLRQCSSESWWTLRLLEEQAKVELAIPVGKDAIGRTLKNTNCDLTKNNTGASRHVNVRVQRTAIAWTKEIQYLVDVSYPGVERIIQWHFTNTEARTKMISLYPKTVLSNV